MGRKFQRRASLKSAQGPLLLTLALTHPVYSMSDSTGGLTPLVPISTQQITAQDSTKLQCPALHCTIVKYTALNCNILHCTTLYCIEFSLTTVHSCFRGSVNCWNPSMENRFQVVIFLFEV